MQWLFWVIQQNLKGIWVQPLVHIFCMSFYKNVPYLILYQQTKFQCHTLFLSQDIKQNVLLSSYLDIDDCKIFLVSTSKAMVDRDKKGKKILKLEYLENEKSSLDEIKKHFLQFLKGHHLVKNKNLIKNSRHKL